MRKEQPNLREQLAVKRAGRVLFMVGWAMFAAALMMGSASLPGNQFALLTGGIGIAFVASSIISFFWSQNKEISQ